MCTATNKSYASGLVRAGTITQKMANTALSGDYTKQSATKLLKEYQLTGKVSPATLTAAKVPKIKPVDATKTGTLKTMDVDTPSTAPFIGQTNPESFASIQVNPDGTTSETSGSVGVLIGKQSPATKPVKTTTTQDVYSTPGAGGTRTATGGKTQLEALADQAKKLVPDVDPNLVPNPAESRMSWLVNYARMSIQKARGMKAAIGTSATGDPNYGKNVRRVALGGR